MLAEAEEPTGERDVLDDVLYKPSCVPKASEFFNLNFGTRIISSEIFLTAHVLTISHPIRKSIS